MRRWFAKAAIVLMAHTLAESSALAADSIAIATGSTGGLYYAAGEAICKAIAARTQSSSPTCYVLTSRGSMANVLELDPVKTPFAIVQSDVQYNAVTAGGLFATVGADSNLRSVFSLHGEAFTVLVRADSGLSSIADLKTRKFSAGRIGTGTREAAEALFEVLGWTPEDRKNLADVAVAEQSAALCAGQVDAIAYLIGHPSQIVTAATEACPVKLVPLPKEAVDGLTRKLLYYRPATISAGTYQGNDIPVPTVGLRSALVTRSEVPDRVVGEIVAAVFGNLQLIRDAAPAFAGLIPGEMSTQGLIAPLHPAALEYYRAQGLPTPSVEITPATSTPIDEKEAGIRDQMKLDPELAVPVIKPGIPQPVQKPAYNSVPVGPGDKWELQSGTRDLNDPALSGSGSLPDADGNFRLRMPSPE
jgi:TRAP transporter TAXI family solute receptor